jgi:hypothetical protein
VEVQAARRLKLDGLNEFFCRGREGYLHTAINGGVGSGASVWQQTNVQKKKTKKLKHVPESKCD